YDSAVRGTWTTAGTADISSARSAAGSAPAEGAADSTRAAAVAMIVVRCIFDTRVLLRSEDHQIGHMSLTEDAAHASELPHVALGGGRLCPNRTSTRPASGQGGLARRASQAQAIKRPAAVQCVRCAPRLAFLALPSWRSFRDVPTRARSPQ